MKKLTRRDFLLSLAAGLGAVTFDQFLTACSQNEPTVSPTSTRWVASTQTPVPTVASSSTPAGTQEILSPTEEETTTAAPTEIPVGASDLVIARNGDPEELVRRAIAALGGMEKFVSPGSNVIIKPNICVAYHTYEYAATTNPWVVAGLVKLCLEAGARSVRVMDMPFGGTAKEAYKISGIEEQVNAAGGEMAFMPGFKYVKTDVPQGKDLKSLDVFDEILKADVLINVPIAKHHNLAGLTLGMKNLMGVIRDRTAMHRDLGQRLADLSSLVKPTLNVVDAVRILMDHGPTGGNLADVKQLDTVIVSQDIVAGDSFAATLFGRQPEDLNYIKAAAGMGLGRSDLENLKIEEINVNG
jgi:uncharacterized protein (DUF362 family)